MNTEVSAARINSYRKKGFLVLDDFLTNEELATWREMVCQAVAEQTRDPNAFTNVNSGTEYYQNVFVQCVNLWKTHDAVKALILNPKLGKLAADLSAVPGVRLYSDHALFKKQWANPTNWHVDNRADPYFSRQSGMIWIALDDATLQNGCLYFLPGTHQEVDFEQLQNEGPLDRATIDGLFVDYPHWAQREPVAAEVMAGGAVYIHGLVAHAAGPNMSPRTRRVMAMLFMPEGATYNGQKSALPEEYVAQLQIGDVLDNDRYLPAV